MRSAVDAIKNGISNGTLRPNQKLTEVMLTRQLNISRTPLREALHRLEAEGYVRSLPAGGFAVIDHDTIQVQELWELRQALEGFAALLACQRMTKKQAPAIALTNSKMVKAMQDGDLASLTRLDGVFHDKLYAGCGNERLFGEVQTVRGYFFCRRAARLLTLNDWSDSVEMHQKIVDALTSHDCKRVQELIQEHVGRGMRLSLQRMP